ncbi:MAG: DUF4203 domain-containing protein, partial [Acidobacteriota bacterium]
PYGHGRFETAASLVLGLLLAGTGAGILIAAAGRLQDIGSAPPVGVAAMWAAIFTLAAKEGLFRYMLAKAERLRSPMLVANAWHARADALSSLVVAAGIAGALIGFNFADAVAAIIVGAMIVHFAWTPFHVDPPWYAVVIAAVVGALIALSITRYMIIVGTAFGGSWMLIVGAMALMGNKAATQAANEGSVWLVYPLDPTPGQWKVWALWFALAIVGAVVQVLMKSKGKGKRK